MPGLHLPEIEGQGVDDLHHGIMSNENEMMEFLERFGKLSAHDADDVEVYSLTNKSGSIVTYFNFDGAPLDKVLEIMILQIKNKLWDRCWMVENNE